MNTRELLIRTVLDSGVPEERVRHALRILQERDMRKEAVSGESHGFPGARGCLAAMDGEGR